MKDNLNYFVVGAAGDLFLQVLVVERGDVKGLSNYFQKHGFYESLTIAGGIMVISKELFDYLKIKENNTNLFMFGGVLDLIFRYGRLYPSLDEYYQATSVIESFIYAGISMVLPKLL